MVAYGWPRERYANGVISYTAEVVAGMRRIGAEPHVAVFKQDPDARDNFVSRVPSLEMTYGPLSRTALAVCRKVCPHRTRLTLAGALLRAEIERLTGSLGADICEIEDTNGWACPLARHSPIPVVVRLHGPWFLNGAALGVRQDRDFRRRVRDEGRGIAAAHGVTAPSRAVLEAVRSFYGLALKDADVIPNPIAPVASNERWCLHSCEPDRILFVGRFDRHKGGDLIIDALAKLRSVRPGCRLTFVGPDDGVISPDGRRTHLREYVDRRLPGAFQGGVVEWLTHQPPERLADLRRRAMITVVCSRYETFGMTAVEAMSRGCPVVAAQAGGLAEIIRDGENGLLCTPGSADDLAEKVLALLRNPDLAARLGAQAAVDAETRYCPDTIAMQTLAFYRRVIDAFARSGRGCRQRERDL